MRAQRERRDVPRELEERRRYVVTDNSVKRGADSDSQRAHLAHLGGRDTGESVTAYDVDHHQLGARLRRDSRCASYQGFRLRSPGHGNDDTLARFPGIGDLVLGPVFRQCGVHLIGHPQQSQFA